MELHIATIKRYYAGLVGSDLKTQYGREAARQYSVAIQAAASRLEAAVRKALELQEDKALKGDRS